MMHEGEILQGVWGPRAAGKQSVHFQEHVGLFKYFCEPVGCEVDILESNECTKNFSLSFRC